MKRESHRQSFSLKLFLLRGIVGLVLMVLVLFVLGFLNPGYSQLSQAGSELGAVGAPNGWVLDLTFIAFGLLMIAFAFGLNRTLIAENRKTVSTLVTIFGLGEVGAGVFPCDSGCPIPGETLSGNLHYVAGLAGFIALTIAPLVLWRSARNNGGWKGTASYSLTTGIVSIVTFLLFAVLGKSILSSWFGLLERLFLAPLFLWIIVVAMKLLWFDFEQPARIA